jgi:hypothetical protein
VDRVTRGVDGPKEQVMDNVGSLFIGGAGDGG